jgi:hypothetical protein
MKKYCNYKQEALDIHLFIIYKLPFAKGTLIELPGRGMQDVMRT